MIKLNWVTVRGDDGNSPYRYQTLIENGMAVLSIWSVQATWQVEGVHFTEYRRVS